MIIIYQEEISILKDICSLRWDHYQEKGQLHMEHG